MFSLLKLIENPLRQNTRLYDLKGQGAPEDWCTQQGQSEPKLMVFNVVYGDGIVFGPYPIHNRPYNQHEYIRLDDFHICILTYTSNSDS